MAELNTLVATETLAKKAKISRSLPFFSSQGNGQVNVHARKVMQEKNATTANLALRVTQLVSAVTVVQRAV